MDEFLKNKFVAWIALAVVGYSGVANINLAIDPDARPDPYTGTRGDKHESRTKELEKWVELTELRLQAIESDGKGCRERVDNVKRKIDKHLEVSDRKILEYNVKLREHDIRINDCLRRTGLQ